MARWSAPSSSAPRSCVRAPLPRLTPPRRNRLLPASRPLRPVRAAGYRRSPRGASAALRIVPRRLRHDADAEYRLLGLIQQFELPFGIFRQLAQDAAGHVGADIGHLFPGGAI